MSKVVRGMVIGVGVLCVAWVLGAWAHASAPGIPLGCKDYVVMLEANSGPIPRETKAPRLLNPPRFYCDDGYTPYLGNQDGTGGLVLCMCGTVRGR